MKIALPVLLALTTLTSAVHADDEPKIEIKKEVKVIVAGDDADSFHFETDDLDIGESRQFFTDSGKEVLITRTEDGLEVEVDGEELDIRGLHKQHVVIKTDGERLDEAHQILIETLGEGEHGDHSFVFHGGGAKVIQLDGSDFQWSTSDDDDTRAFVMKLERRSAADHLESSGALDDLDEATRQRVLDALKQFDATPHIGESEHDIQIIREHRHDEHEEY